MYKITCFGSSGGHEGEEQSPARIRAQLRKMEQKHITEETVSRECELKTAASVVPISTEHANKRPPGVSD